MSKKPGPAGGPVSVIADVGVGNIFQRGTCCPPAILGGYPSGATARLEYAEQVRERQRRASHDCHAQSQFAPKSEMPALGVGYEEVTEHLDARDRFEFLGINKERIERERVRLTE